MLGIAICCLASCWGADGQDEPPVQTIEINDSLPYGQSPIDYYGVETDSAISRLNAQIASGEVKLDYHPLQGYLPAVLRALNVPVESQLLVYSKTARNQRLISPTSPRAVYFTDDVSVAWVPEADALELSAVDANKGGLFYMLSQAASDVPQFERSRNCLACHAGTTTMSVPGFMVRSFLVDRRGKPLEGYSRISHDSPLSQRWGGWFVSGTHGEMTHLGNLLNKDDNRQHKIDARFRGNMTDLAPLADLSAYPSPHSDVVAQLVLAHQAHGQNLLIRAAFENRLNRKSVVEERLLRYLFFADEAPLAGPVVGTSGYQAWFMKQGPHDPNGRSLRDFDLQTRMFRYRLSYLVYSSLFDNLPTDVKTRLYQHMWNILTGQAPAEERKHLTDTECQAIIAILRETKPDLPSYWQPAK